MSVRRVMGIETEYGIVVPGDPHANPMNASADVVDAYARAAGIRATEVTWDYADESPLRDVRGFVVERGAAHRSQLTDEDPRVGNVILDNGARLYVDHAHPEYSSPEVTTPRDALTWDRAGELVMLEAAAELARAERPINLYKNNTDGKGASYGTHENYLMSRGTPFDAVVTHLTPFFVARQVLCGAGRVGLGVDSGRTGFQISSRADFFEAEVGLETTIRRPIINTRDEPHADPDKYRRLHVIIGDANLSDVANLLKLGTTSLVLAMIEAGALTSTPRLADPVAALIAISHDPTLRVTVPTTDGRSLRGVDLLEYFCDEAERFVAENGEAGDPATREVLYWWRLTLDRLRRDPMDARAEVEWVAKLALLDAYADRDGLELSDPRARAIDLQWGDIRPDKGIAQRLRSSGGLRQLVSDDAVREAVSTPPPDTRAWMRGRTLTKFRGDVLSASWDALIFAGSQDGPPVRVPMPEPLAGTQAEVGDLLEQSSGAAGLLARLAAHRGD